ncbi:DinB family protein [Priestia taiwanensis]|uniref:DNA damage-inducible protein DinB n=1 Tax=Priestia taiwanensis TaxID=1347902 RepID=A0A917ALI0_9BACI|nr:DinB family protein [Priestia taiwanensis]MBM7362241.1 putative damage-inducible protein DinB [Priestia taiwanensis]GGE60563.1 DNA damage-inducible protein DinB [Priestia taiwanensis]
MIHLFQYNWQIRDEWFTLCEQLPERELRKERVGGPGSILYTLFHIVEVEHSWICAMQGKPDIPIHFENYQSLEAVKKLSDSLRLDSEPYLLDWSENIEQEQVYISWLEETFLKGEVIRHVIAHETHHIGQLSIWTRELGIEPVSVHFVGRNLM